LGWIVETAVVFAALMALDYFRIVPFATVTPHPFWLPVILFSATYGTGPGLVSAILASSLGWISHHTPITPDADYYSWFLASWREPMLWFVAALTLGEIARRARDERRRLAEKLDDAEAQRQVIAGHCIGLREHIAALEHRIVTADVPLAERVLVKVGALQHAPPHEIEARSAAVLSLILGATHVHVALPRAGGWTPARIGAADGNRPSIPPQVMDAIAHAGRAFWSHDPDDARLLAGMAAFAVPVIDPENARVHALLVAADVRPDARETSRHALPLLLWVLAIRLRARTDIVVERPPRWRMTRHAIPARRPPAISAAEERA
jgi:hypothetical protein